LQLQMKKTEKEKIRLTAGEDRINCLEDCDTLSADMILVKCLLNSVVLTKGAKCLMIDIKDFYLNTPMKCYEYMHLKITDILEEIIKEYRLDEKVTEDRYIYTKIQKGIYSLPQAGIIAQELLENRLAKHGYTMQNHFRILEACHKTNMLHSCDQQLCSQIHDGTGCRTFD
jgi:hypothetical protein